MNRGTAGSRRQEVADFWDSVLERWLDGDGSLVPPLDRWHCSYAGKGKGAVDMDHYPDPYVGDLRGVRGEPRLIVLGLNPGIGYPSLQSRDGLWAQRIAEVGYSRCFERSPAEDPESWKELHGGKESRYWANLIRFARRWLRDDAAGVHDILNMELYPWHSSAVTASMQSPADLIDRFVWQPVQEIRVSHVFAFGATWFGICQELGLEPVAVYGDGGKAFPTPVAGRWRLGCYALPSGQIAVVSSQAGYAGPPGVARLEVMRWVLRDLGS